MPTPSLERNGEPIRLPPPTADIPVIETGGYLGQLLALANDVAHDEVPLMNATSADLRARRRRRGRSVRRLRGRS
jgi:hypothetical protein